MYRPQSHSSSHCRVDITFVPSIILLIMSESDYPSAPVELILPVLSDTNANPLLQCAFVIRRDDIRSGYVSINFQLNRLRGALNISGSSGLFLTAMDPAEPSNVPVLMSHGNLLSLVDLAPALMSHGNLLTLADLAPDAAPHFFYPQLFVLYLPEFSSPNTECGVSRLQGALDYIATYHTPPAPPAAADTPRTLKRTRRFHIDKSELRDTKRRRHYEEPESFEPLDAALDFSFVDPGVQRNAIQKDKSSSSSEPVTDPVNHSSSSEDSSDSSEYF